MLFFFIIFIPLIVWYLDKKNIPLQLKIIPKNITEMLKRAKAYFKNFFKTEGITSSGGAFRFMDGDFYDIDPMKISTVFACVDAISSDIAKMPLEPYYIDAQGVKRKALNDSTYNLLNFEPNEYMTRFTFMQALVISMLTKGNAFAYIERDNTGTAKALYYVPSDDVTIYRNTKTRMIEYYRVNSSGFVVEPNDMIHLLNFSIDGVVGVSTLSYAGNTLGLVRNSERQALKSFSDNVSEVLSTDNPHLTKEQRDQIRKEWYDNMSEGGSGLAILSGGLNYNKISINAKDAQLLESRAFNVPEICRFFRVSPVKVGDLSKSSYSTVEATNIAYLSDTLSPYLEKIELEFRRKLYPREKKKRVKIEFDPSALLRADSTATAQLYSSLFPLGAITPNELRDKLSLPPIEGGGTAFVMVNTMPLDIAIKGQEEKEQGDEKGN